MIGVAFERDRSRWKDLLVYLPQKQIAEYQRGQVIFSQDQPSTGIYLVSKGKVKITRTTDEGMPVLIDIYAQDEFFGEGGLLGFPRPAGQASAFENSGLMSWTTAEIEGLIQKQPRLGLTLIRMLVDRAIDNTDRLRSMALEKTPQRIERCLLRFAGRLGEKEGDGVVRLPALSHELIAAFIGTSREIVTNHMNELRRLGYIRYSRKHIDIYYQPMKERLDHFPGGQL